MTRPNWATLVLTVVALARPTICWQGVNREASDVHLPNGKSQREEILKLEHQKSLKDATELVDTAEELKAELERNDRHVLSISSLKKTEQIEKLARRIRERLRRY